MIVDASVLLSAFFPDEAQPKAQLLLRQHAAVQRQHRANQRARRPLASGAPPAH